MAMGQEVTTAFKSAVNVSVIASHPHYPYPRRHPAVHQMHSETGTVRNAEVIVL